uniref:Sister chromatid cohesion protein n=1 Tax=Schizophyllum commune (strain H4-8 / FGSC 9210) TaxID=578458 RepID=D8PZC4_SCHCM
MSSNQPWYAGRHDASNQHASPAVLESQRIYAHYPIAAGVPTHHVARHINTLTGPAHPPSFAQPELYAPQGNPPPYSEYAPDVQSYPFPRSQNQDYMHTSTALASSVFQQMTPVNAYPTPPPQSSRPLKPPPVNSLMYALGGGPPGPNRYTQPPVPAEPMQSPQFFDDFLAAKSRQLNVNRAPATAQTPNQGVANGTPRHARMSLPSLLNDSPDPLALTVSPSQTTTKRKSLFQLESPSVKRVSSSQSLREQVPSTPTSQRTAKSRMQSQAEPSGLPMASVSALPATPQVPVTPKKSKHNEALTAHLLKSGSSVMDCVEIQRPAWLTPQSKHRIQALNTGKGKGKSKLDTRSDSPDPLDDYAPVEQLSPTRTKLFNANVDTSPRKTGDRDSRAPLEKFTALLEDVFEAEDALPADFAPPTSSPSHHASSPNHISSDYPSHIFASYVPPGESRHPALSYHFMHGKLSKAIVSVARPRKSVRAGESPVKRAGGRIGDIDMQMLGRLLRILLRSVRMGEELDPFGQAAGRTGTAEPKSPSKKTLGKRRAEPDADGMDVDEEDADEETPEVVAMASDEELDRLLSSLELARDSVEAADCALALLASDRLPKQMYSEELITTCLETIKNHLTKIIYPFIEAIATDRIAEVYTSISASIPRINTLLTTASLAMSDKVIIQTAYLAVEPFFVADSSTDGKSTAPKEDDPMRSFGPSSMKGLRLEALTLLRTVFAIRQDQRHWIIEEILTSLTRLSDTKQKAGQFRLRDGRSIRTVSALLLQLIQTSSHDVAVKARNIEHRRKEMNALKRQESISESQMGLQGQPPPFLDEFDKEELQLYGNGLQSTYSATQTIIRFLIGRIGANKATKNSNEAEYRNIFDTLISDALAVLYLPEWPAASVLLSTAAKHLLRLFDDSNSSAEATSAPAKAIALDHLGTIATRIRTVELKVRSQVQESDSSYLGVKRLSELVKSTDKKGVDVLLQAHVDVAAHLSKRSSDDQAYDSARELTATTLGEEVAACLNSIVPAIDHPDQNDHLDVHGLRVVGNKLKSAMRSLWQEQTSDVFDIGMQDEATQIDRLAEEIGTIQHLPKSFQPILNVVLKALNATATTVRTKALRALAQIISSDPSILSLDDVRRAIEGHLLDSSPSVRDAAVELIGKYMVESPEVAGKYYAKIADRIADTGLGVRKRVIKLLKAFYQVTDDQEKRSDIAKRIVLRQLDEDDTVKDLAIKTIEDLWFAAPSPVPSSRGRKGKDAGEDRAPLLSKVAVIMSVAGQFHDRQSPLEEVLHKIASERESGDGQFFREKYLEVCHTLIDGLVDNSDLPGFTVLNCVKTIYLFTSACPTILTADNGATLLPYLKNATGAEEYAISEHVLKILRASVPHMPKTAVKFGQDLQATLQPMVIKPNMRNLNTLQETIACICAVVKHLTHDYGRLVNLLKSCHNRLQSVLKAGGAITDKQVIPQTVLILIVSLLAEHCNFDALRIEHPEATWVADLDSVAQDSVTDRVYTLLLQLYERNENVSFRGRVLQCLGFLFRAYPTLMSTQDSAVIMDKVFSGDDEEARARILRIMQEFLQSQEQKHAMQERESQKAGGASDVNMDELVGNTDGFADSGYVRSIVYHCTDAHKARRVASAVVQRYLDHVLTAALSQNPVIQSPAIDVLSFTVKQGLAHPLQSFPVIVALETSPNPTVANRASALHAILHSKHASLVNGRYVQSARASYDYQRRVCQDGVKGYRLQPTATAVFQRWYSLVREKRAPRQDFLRALVKVFPDGSTLSATQDEVDFSRYMAENFAALDYKTQEEVLTVIKALTNILATTGTQVLEALSPSHLLSHIRPADAMEVDAEGSEVAPTADDCLPQRRLSVIIAMIMLLKAHLKALYGLSEDKCSKFVVGKKSAIGDKGVTRKHGRPISWDRLPYATQPLLNMEDAERQKATFIEIWNEDGVTAEPDDDFA